MWGTDSIGAGRRARLMATLLGILLIGPAVLPAEGILDKPSVGIAGTKPALSLTWSTKSLGQGSEPLSLSVALSSNIPLREVSLDIEVPKDVKVISGEAAWRGRLAAGESAKHEVIVVPGASEVFQVVARVQGRTPEGKRVEARRQLFVAAQPENRPAGGKLDVPLDLRATVTPEPAIGEVVHLQASVTALISSPGTILELSLPEGLTLVAGPRRLQRDLDARQSLSIEADLRVEQLGEWPVIVSATSSSPGGAQWGRHLTLYLQAGEQSTVTAFSEAALSSTDRLENEPGPPETDAVPPPPSPQEPVKRSGVVGPGGPASDEPPERQVMRAGEMELPQQAASRMETSGAPIKLLAEASWVSLMTQNFEGTFPSGAWQAYDGNGSTNGDYFWDDDDYKPHNGSWSAWAANGGANGLDPALYYYPNNTRSWMMYGPVDLSDANDAELQFYYWNQSESNYDWLGWYASTNGSNFYGYEVSGDSQGWKFVNFDLTNVPTLGDVTGDSSVWIAFVFESDTTNVDDGPFIDDVLLQKYVQPTGGNLTVSGVWKYRDRDGVDHPLPFARVEVWDDDLVGDDLMATAYTNLSGAYNSTFVNDDVSGGVDVYTRVYSTDDYSVNLRTGGLANSIYYSETPVTNDIPDGTFNAGTRIITDAEGRPAFYIYDKIANDAWRYLKDNVGWNNNYNLQVRWSPTSTDGTYYNHTYVALLAGDRWDEDVFLHEYGHFVMDKIYATYPPTPNCNPHQWGVHSGLGCAWSEGWATFLQGAIQGSASYKDTEDQTINNSMEPPSPTAHHPEDEGAVNASLWDIFDNSGSNESWDSLAKGINGSSSNGIWNIVFNQDPVDVNEFRNSWYASGNGFVCQVGSILNQHLIAHNSPGYSLSTAVSPSNTGSIGTNPSSNCIGGEYAPGTVVALTANASAGYSFSGWSGNCSGSSPTCNLTMNANKSVTANFTANPVTYTLSVTNQSSGGGAVASTDGGINCGGDCSQIYNSGASVTLVANPISGYSFAGWGGSCSGTSITCSITMTANKSVMANFTANQVTYTLSVTNQNPGGGTVTSTDGGINCGGDCSQTYTPGVSVTLGANPSAGYVFAGWGGSCSGTSTTYQIAMNSSKLCTAAFITTNSGLDFYTIAPCRVYDTRIDGTPLTSATTYYIQVAGYCGIPTSAKAVTANVTVVGSTGVGYVILWPADLSMPLASTINFSVGQVRANNAILRLATDGLGDLAARATLGNGGTVHLIIDVSGYFQ